MLARDRKKGKVRKPPKENGQARSHNPFSISLSCQDFKYAHDTPGTFLKPLGWDSNSQPSLHGLTWDIF